MPDIIEYKTANRVFQYLSSNYPRTELGNKKNPLQEAVYILLSSQTTEINYKSTYKSFRLSFPSLTNALYAPISVIYKSIKSGGLGLWKAHRISTLLHQVYNRYGKLSLSHLSDLDDDELESELCELDGIGIKSARCIMMYSFARNVFPVDTHTLRIMKRIGFRIPRFNIKSRKFADAIQNQIPPKFRHRFHVNIIQHGRSICKSRPLCNQCIINNLCKTGKKMISELHFSLPFDQRNKRIEEVTVRKK